MSNQPRLRLKVAFFVKVFSSILDYGIDFELLQFHYDLWLCQWCHIYCKKIALLSCTGIKCEDVLFWLFGKCNINFYRMLLISLAIDHYFLTISPYEWTFAMAHWIENIRNTSGREATHLAAYKTIHIVHTLEQVLRGYLCGTNTKKWSRHVFSYENRKGCSNVNFFFYRCSSSNEEQFTSIFYCG